MSKIGKKPILFSQDISLEQKGSELLLKSPKGEISLTIPDGISLVIEKGKICLVRNRQDRKTRANHGTIRSLIKNAVLGLEEGWEKKLEVIGTGYRVSQQENQISLKLGFSHPVLVSVPPDLTVTTEGNLIIIRGVDKQSVGDFASKLRRLSPPDVYKGKGIRYFGEEIKLKPGKMTKTETGGGGAKA